MKSILCTIALTFAAATAFAQATPVGLWKTIDDETKQEKSFVRISEAGGVLSGKVEKLLDPSKQDAKCDKCTDARKDKPVLGMTIVEGVKKNPEEAYWDGGTILDPNNGKVYKVRMTPKSDGKILEVRGFMTIGRLAATQTWVERHWFMLVLVLLEAMGLTAILLIGPGVVLRVIVCDDISWARAELDGEWVDCDTYLPAIGDVLPDPVPV